jgi:phosphoglycolate phosphatase-like HAD superfamily hydrolase
MERKFTVFLDMDGVMTDFNNAFINIPANKENLTFEQYDQKYGFPNAWKLIDNEGIEWWSEMNWMVDGRDVWNYFKKYDPIILSAPSRHPDSAKGKEIWVRRELGLDIDRATRSPKYAKWDENSRMILNSDKYRFSQRFPNSILIDDTKKKIVGWTRAGGIGIIHGNARDTIAQFEKIIKKL